MMVHRGGTEGLAHEEGSYGFGKCPQGFSGDHGHYEQLPEVQAVSKQHSGGV